MRDSRPPPDPRPVAEFLLTEFLPVLQTEHLLARVESLRVISIDSGGGVLRLLTCRNSWVSYAFLTDPPVIA